MRADDFSQQPLEIFQKQIRPLLVEHWLQCHGPEKQEGGFNLSHSASPITATTGTFSDHHESEETNDLIGDDGWCYADQYARKDSNLQPSVP
ncbi:MAG: hypothetical protein ACKPJD_10355, partial [Planctomycetaceae bacterium]